MVFGLILLFCAALWSALSFLNVLYKYIYLKLTPCLKDCLELLFLMSDEGLDQWRLVNRGRWGAAPPFKLAPFNMLTISKKKNIANIN